MDYSINLNLTQMAGLLVCLMVLTFIAVLIGYARCEKQNKERSHWNLQAYKKLSIELVDAQRDAEYYKKAVDLLAAAHERDLAREILKAKREHGKKIRKQADRKLEKAERDCEVRLNEMLVRLNQWKHDAHKHVEYAACVRFEFSQFQSIISDVLENQVKLRPVRNKLFDEINKRHKQLKETLA